MTEQTQPTSRFKPEWRAAIDAMRSEGFAVVVFTPEELGDAVDASNLENILVERGNDAIGWIP